MVDDYGHHPAEIRATLAAAREVWPDRRIVVGFQPHRYSRTHGIFRDFISAFHDADLLFVFEVYPAGEEPIPGATTSSRAVGEHGHKAVIYAGRAGDARQGSPSPPGGYIPDDGAGDVWKLEKVYSPADGRAKEWDGRNHGESRRGLRGQFRDFTTVGMVLRRADGVPRSIPEVRDTQGGAEIGREALPGRGQQSTRPRRRRPRDVMCLKKTWGRYLLHGGQVIAEGGRCSRASPCSALSGPPAPKSLPIPDGGRPSR